jgi:hypothetical protein
VAKDPVPSIHRYMLELRNSLVGRGILVPDGDGLKLAQDSPSAASGVLLGRTSNGRVDWKDDEGRTLKKIQATAVEEAPG